MLLFSCGGGKDFNHGDTVYVSQKCIAAVDEDSYSQMTDYCARKDERGLENMEARGLITILPYGTEGTVTKMGFGKIKIRLNDNREYWCANEFIDK